MVRKKKSNIKRIMNRVINFLLILVITIFATSSLYVSKIWFDETNMFDLKKIIVKNDFLITKGEIIELSKLKKGIRVFDIRIDEIEERISESKYISKSSIEIIYPATIVIKVTEEDPIAFCLIKNELKFVDSKGTIMGNVNPRKSFNLPIILEKKNRELVIELLNESRNLSPFVYHEISEVSFLKNTGLIVSLIDNSAKVIFGIGDIDKKILVLENFLRDKNKDISLDKTYYIDLRFKNQVVVKEDKEFTNENTRSEG